MRKLSLLCAIILVLVAYLSISATATTVKVCENASACFDEQLKQGASSTTASTVAALTDSEIEEESQADESTVALPIAENSPLVATIKRRRRTISICDPPKIRMSRSSILIGDRCYLGCSWFYLESTKKSLCNNCPTMIVYKPQTRADRVATKPKKVSKKSKAKTTTQPKDPNQHICFDLPKDINSGRIPANFTNYAKELCAQSCKCSNETIREENVGAIQVHRAKAFAIFNTMMKWTTSAVEKYYSGVNSKLNLLSTVNSKKCNDRRTAVLNSQQEIVKSLREAAEETRAVMTLAQEQIKGDAASELLNDFVKTFNQKTNKLHTLMKNQVKSFAKSLNNLCISDQITMGIASKSELKAAKKAAQRAAKKK